MAPRRAQFYTYGSDDSCAEVKKYIENAGILLEVRDIKEKPFSVNELASLIGYLDIKHFLNSSSQSYKKHGLDKKLPTQTELFELMVADHTLIKSPIVCSKRLVTVGCNKQRIAEMLQIGPNGEATELIEPRKFNVRTPSSGGRSSMGRSSSRHSAYSRK
ncbi:MAG: ArsC/Spx/MgsR family protein [candidate division Zixibacteria bacterium]|nr:ArsC/Spx/MgsR family protein [candidate division Zixibacteria bacterium]